MVLECWIIPVKERTRTFFLIMHEDNILHKNLLINKIKLKNYIQVFTHGHIIFFFLPGTQNTLWRIDKIFNNSQDSGII